MKKILIGLLTLLSVNSFAQKNATLREYEKSFTTYPFSNPNPVADPSSLFYPYFRYDGFTDKAIKKDWKVVELENDFIKILILPQIGGKIWTAYDKVSGKPFIYDNDAVKFRDIAMRGPWTSGGLEANFGIFGHTPGVATPVNYLTEKNSDGSVSCIISLLDQLTQTRWNMEIKLPKDKAYFVTKFTWHNGTSLPQPYYSWMNLGEKVSDSLEYIFPGNHHIFHDGKLFDFPINPDNRKNISIYNQNDFGPYKSYHVTGTYSKYFGVFYRKENFGMIHFSEREAKIGKKIWIWGLSRQGMIWEKLLTDKSGQYTEIQSGRLYNQNAPESLLTPFKQFEFAPYNTDTWSEYWYPFKDTDGVNKADLNGVFNVETRNGEKVIRISPVSYINDTLKVWDTNNKIVVNKPVSLEPLKPFEFVVPVEKNFTVAKITLAGTRINLVDSASKILDRPLEALKDFDWSSAYGYYLKGKYEADTRHYKIAELNIRKSLEKNPGFVPALNELSFLQYRKLNYDSAFTYAKTALSVNTYDPASNYYYGLAALKLGKIYDAKDGFEVAAITPQYRSAAYTELSKIKMREKDFAEAFNYAEKSLETNVNNVSALQLQLLSAKFLKKDKDVEQLRLRILKLDPLNHFVRFERYWNSKSAADKAQFTSLIRDELPQQTYLDLAIWYANLNLEEESKAVLDACPQKTNEIFYWLAWLNRNDKSAEVFLKTANEGSANMVFPFRAESVDVMQWALQQSSNWKPRYYLALIYSFRDHREKALKLMDDEGAPSDFAPFYVFRSKLRDSTDFKDIQLDLNKAMQIDGKDWRYGKYVVNFLLEEKQDKSALQTIQTYYKKDVNNYMIGILYIRCLMLNGKYEEAERIFNNINILPYEGAKDAHSYYEQTKLMLALKDLKSKNYKRALQKVQEARLWPERLGEGKPYPEAVDNKIEDDLQKVIEQTADGTPLKKEWVEEFYKAINRIGATKAD